MIKRKHPHVTGPLAAHTEGFAVVLADRGYRSSSARNQLLRMAQLSGWLDGRQLSSADLTVQAINEFLADRRRPATRPGCHRSGCRSCWVTCAKSGLRRLSCRPFRSRRSTC